MIRATVSAAHLAAAMKHSIAARRGVLPVLQHALVEAEGAFVSITTTDLESTCTVTIPATVEEAGAIAADAEKLAASAAAGSELRLDEMDGVLRVRGAGRSLLRVSTLPASEFPKPDEEAWQPLPIDGAALRAAIAGVLYAAPTGDIRAYLNTVHVRAGWVEATDGKLFARAPYAHKGPPLMIPSPRAQQIARLLDDGSTADVAVASDGRARMLRVAGGPSDESVQVRLSTLMVNAQYPDMDRVLSTMTDPDYGADVERAELRRAAASMQPFASEIAKMRIAWLAGDAQGMRLVSSDGGELSIASAQATEGEIKIGVRIDMLGKALDAIEDDTVRLERVEQKGGGAFLRMSTGSGAEHFTAECTV